MKLTSIQKNKLFLSFKLGLVGVFLSLLLIFFTNQKEIIVESSLIGFSVGFLIGLFENFFTPIKSRKFSFPVSLIIRASVYSIIIIFSAGMLTTIKFSVVKQCSIIEAINTQGFSNYVFENDFFSTIKATVINRPERLFDILSIIAKCEYYIGSSLHGAIASISFLNKIIIIADEEETRISKFSGFVNQLDLSDSLFKNWKDACKVINKRGLYSFKGIEKDRLNYIKAVSINNWNKIYNSFVNYKNRRSPTHMDESILRIISNYFGI